MRGLRRLRHQSQGRDLSVWLSISSIVPLDTGGIAAATYCAQPGPERPQQGGGKQTL
jgi:hypothetical protein